jgi:hypothetical protein
MGAEDVLQESMGMTTLLGFLAVAASGLFIGAGVWPYKLVRRYRFEHWSLLSAVVGGIVIPWTVIFLGCPNSLQSLANVPVADLVRSNLFSLAWGASCVLSTICYVRIGIGLTIALLVGLGIPVGSLTTLVFKGSGLFHNAPALGSPAGLTILASVVLMLIGAALVALAGFGRDRQLPTHHESAGGFAGGLVMMVVAGLLVGCMNFAFVYSQESVLGNLSSISPGDSISVVVSEQGKERFRGEYAVSPDRSIDIQGLGRISLDGPSAWQAARQIEKRWEAVNTVNVRVLVTTGSLAAAFGASVIPLFSGVLLVCGYSVYLLFRNRTWGIFLESGGDMVLSFILGINGALSYILWGKGTLMLGAVGASIGWGISQATKVVGSQGLAYFSGEWRGVKGAPRYQMWLAVTILIVASIIMAYGKTLSNH